MIKNPYLNAVWAALYIVIIVTVINKFTSIVAIQQTLYIPMVMLSLFVFSAAIMGLLFIYEPLKLFLEGKKEAGLHFFFKTLGTFALCILAFVTLLLR